MYCSCLSKGIIVVHSCCCCCIEEYLIIITGGDGASKMCDVEVLLLFVEDDECR